MRDNFVLVLLLLLLSAPSAMADEAPVLEVDLPTATVSVGDRVEARVLARGGENMMWGELSVEIEPGGTWELVDGPRPVSGARPPVWEFTLAAMEVGELDLPTLSATIRPRDGEPQIVTLNDAPTVTVASVLPPGEEVEPAPMRDPMGVSGLPWEWLLPIALVLLPLAALGVWWWRRRRRSDGEEALRKLPPFAELETVLLRLSGRVGQEPMEGICDGLAGSLRRYLERRCGEPAQEMTSFELRLLARRLAWPGPVQSGIQQVMDTADGVRFGKRPSPESAIKEAIDRALAVARALENHFQPQAESVNAEEVAR